MRHLVFILLGIILNGTIPAQDLLPELAGPAKQYRTAAETLEQRRLAETARAAKSYVDTLTQLEKGATAKGEITLLEAFAKERQAALNGELKPDMPPELPALRLQGVRKALQIKLARINSDAAGRKKHLDSQYFGVLTAIEKKSGPESELAKQVAAEKALLLASASNGMAENGKTHKPQQGKNAVVNGDFEKLDSDGCPEGWMFGTPEIFVTEKGNRFVRFNETASADGVAKTRSLRQTDIAIPSGARKLKLVTRMRTLNCVSRAKTDPRFPQVSICFKNKGAELVSYLKEGRPFFYLCTEWNRKSTWNSFEREGPVPKEAVSVNIELSNGQCSGMIDFDDVAVYFE
ncbi:MAG: hypothetical protein RBT78_04945 [Kiritimatiellia bacterium]|jgi:hypothetical protein|nr:hypothetical protein [Kiritimatiellia bacterium]